MQAYALPTASFFSLCRSFFDCRAFYRQKAESGISLVSEYLTELSICLLS